MTKHLLAGASAIAIVAGLGVSAAYANPTAKDNDGNYYSAIGNVYNSVYVGIGQNANADGYGAASADGNTYYSDAYAGAEGVGGWAGDNYATVYVNVETNNVAIISENEMYASVSNYGSVDSLSYYGSADSSTGDASQNEYQQSNAAGMFNNALNTGLGNAQQQGNSVAVNVGTINFNGASD